MEKIKIDANGSLSIPTVGNMKITVEMTENIFEEFLEYRKNKEYYNNKASKEIEGLKNRLTFLAKAVLVSINGETPKQRKAAKAEAVERANDWFI